MQYRELLKQLKGMTPEELNQDVIVRLSDGEHLPIQKIVDNKTVEGTGDIHADHRFLHSEAEHSFYQVGEGYDQDYWKQEAEGLDQAICVHCDESHDLDAYHECKDGES